MNSTKPLPVSEIEPDLDFLARLARTAEGRDLLDQALGEGPRAEAARERLALTNAQVEAERAKRAVLATRDRRAIAGYQKRAARAKAGDSAAQVELLRLAKFLVEFRVPKLGNLDHAICSAVATALGAVGANLQPKPRVRRSALEKSRAVFARVRLLQARGQTKTEAVAAIAREGIDGKPVNERTVYRLLAKLPRTKPRRPRFRH